MAPMEELRAAAPYEALRGFADALLAGGLDPAPTRRYVMRAEELLWGNASADETDPLYDELHDLEAELRRAALEEGRREW